MTETPALDPFARLRRATPARIGLGRTGTGLPTDAMLAFQRAHAQARDAVLAELDPDALVADLGRDAQVVSSQAPTRADYIQNPDLGRRLGRPETIAGGSFDAAIVIADGLSALGVHRHAPALLAALLPHLAAWKIAPLIVVRNGRVAIGDEIAARLGAGLVLVLIGERPGLSSPDSLGAYLTWAPGPGTPDSARNCVSNIRTPDGLSPAMAAARIAWLMNEARRLGLSGTALKDRSEAGERPLLEDSPTAPSR